MTVEPRLYLDAPLNPGARLDLEKDQAHYLVNVMRRGAGDAVRVFNGRDGEWRAEISDATRKRAALTLLEQTRAQTAAPDLHLYFSPVKKARTDFIVEKATELGAAAITPVMTRRTMADRVRMDRMEALVREAAEQTERLDLPRVGEPVSLVQLLKGWDETRKLIFCDEAGGEDDAPWGGETGRAAPILEALSGAQAGAWAILIGPEGGFDPAERNLLRGQRFVVPVTLGPRILRADTAVAAAMSVWQAVLGDWG
ncbi:MAG: 16S rRNA (uracil(1498)-N(3))-methyltransferase [Oceanicaulis sp.]